MSWYTKLFGSTPGPGSDFWYNPVTSLGNAGVDVTHATAMQSSVVYACVKIISGAIASLPLKVFRRLPGGDKTELPEHPLFSILHDQANDEHTAQEFTEMMTAFAVMRGTSYAEIIPGARGFVDQLIPFHPDHITLNTQTDNSGRKRRIWEIRIPGEPKRIMLRDELFVYRALVMNPDGISGIDPIMAEAAAIGAKLASQDYGARFFQNDAQAGLILKHPASFKTKADRDRFIEGWQSQSTGSSRHKSRVLEFGMEPHTITMTNDQAQFLETQKYQDTDIARIFQVQQHKVGLLERSSFDNIEQQAIEWVTDSLMPWAVRWTQSIKRDLILQSSIFAEHNFNALLRGDTEQRFRGYAIARNWGWLSANDIRRKENENTIGPEGDTYLQPLNMAPAGDPAEPSGMGSPAPQAPPRATVVKPNGKAHEQT